jgi:hypothetical protein
VERCVYVRKKRFKGTFLTEEEYRVLAVLLKYGRVSDAARVLGKAQPTISIVKRRIEDKVEKALETVRLAVSLGLVDREALLGLLGSAREQSRIVEYEERALLGDYRSILGEVANTTIERTTPGLLELIEHYTVRRETVLRATRLEYTVEKPLYTVKPGRVVAEESVG